MSIMTLKNVDSLLWTEEGRRMKLVFAVAFALFALSALDRVDSSAYDKIVTHSRIRARDQGPNVCALQQVEGTKKKYFSTCRNWYHGKICGKKAVVMYECCPGYTKLEGTRGCPAVAPIDHVYGTLGLVGTTTTQKYSETAKLREEIEGPGSYTMFAPSNDAWELLNPTERSSLVNNVNLELYNALHYHMTDSRLLTKDLKDGMMIPSMYLDLDFFINHYPNGVVTVNCARIIHANQVATNGVVHVIDRVIKAVGRTIQDIVENDSELSSLSSIAMDAGLLEKLSERGHFTLFAPTNRAFDKLDREVLRRLKGNKDALRALLNFHLLDSMLCAEAIMVGASYETLEGHNIEIGCDGESLTVNGVKMVLKKDIVATNGVVHLIDEVLIPDSAKQVMELVGPSQAMFADMISELGLSAQMRSNVEYTLLAPFNTVFTQEVLSMEQDELMIMLQNHILKSKVVLSQLYDGQRLETLGGKTLRVFLYRTAVCIENSCLVRGSKEGINGALHLMRTFIKPAVKNMFQILKSSGRFKIFLSLMEAAGLTDILRQEGSYTLFAPTDDAFVGLSQQDIATLKSDADALKTFLLYHFSKGIFIGGGLETGVTNLLSSLQGNYLKVLLINNTISVNSMQLPETDMMATNGVVHFVKTFLYPGDVPVGNQELLSLLQRIIKNIQIKYVPGYRYKEIPVTFIKRVVTRVPVTRVIQGPTTKITRVIGRGSQQ
uniref:Periostin, osteoblast specific factor b n=2 Tax=Scleropages formosus TaxID=113540 RepID=A0A8C9QVI1_SCLFO